MFERIVFGIDVSSRTSHVCVMDNRTVVQELVIGNNRPGFNKLGACLKAYRQPEVVFEATGVYSKRLERFLEDIQQPYAMLNPLKAKMQLAEFSLNKDDKHDARNLALSQYSQQRALTYEPAAPYRELKFLSHYYEEVNKDYVRNCNRLHRLLQYTFPELEGLCKTHRGNNYWKLVTMFPHPAVVLTASPQLIIRKISRLPRLSHKRAKDLTQRLFYLAHLAYPAVSVHSYVLEEVALTAQTLINLKQNLDHLIAEMFDVSKALKQNDVQLIESLPGAGKKTALRLVAELGDVRRFPTSAKLNAYVGIDLRKYESGNFIAARHISKRGNAIARKLAYLLAQDMVSAVMRHPQLQSHIADFYLKRKKSSPATKPKKILIAAAHRVLRTIWILINKNQVYDYEKACAKH